MVCSPGIDTLMNDVSPPASAVSEPLTWAQICERYPDQWVALIEIEWADDHNLKFRTARVAGNGKTRREPLVQARPLRVLYPQIGHFFTGPIIAPMVRPFL
jgi:hypothetical protein